jgi:head-tail adaptor
MAYRDLLTHTVTVTRKTWTQGSGGARVASTVVLGTFPALVQATKSDRRDAGGKDASITTFKAYFAVDPNVNATDEITWEGRALSVVGPARDMGGQGRAFVVDALEVR